MKDLRRFRGVRSAYGGETVRTMDVVVGRERCIFHGYGYISTLNHGLSILYLVALILTHEGQLLNLHRLF